MSSKVTIMHDKKADWHFFYDYKDGRPHLTVGRKEVELPESFMWMVKSAVEIHQFEELVKGDKAAFAKHEWNREEKA